MRLDERGLTLAEILVAIAIIGVGLVGLAVVIPVSSYGVQEGNQLSTATFLAEQMIERARAAAWSATPPTADCLGVSPGGATPTGPPVPTGATCNGSAATQFPDETMAGVGVAGYPQYTRIVRVVGCDATPCAGVNDATMRLVTVTVTYMPLTAAGQSPAPKTVTLQWLVSQK